MSEYVKEMLHQERLERENYLEVLHQTPGFPLLSETQQRILTQSLYIQQRAERVLDYESRLAISKPRDLGGSVRIHSEGWLLDLANPGFTVYPERRGNKYSQEWVANMFCHAAILQLETSVDYEIQRFFPKKFFEAEYHRAPSLNELSQYAHDQGYPCVLHIAIPPGLGKENHAFVHSCLILGPDNTGSIIVWEKEGVELPFRLTTLEAVYSEYKEYEEDHLWGVRPVRNPSYYE